MRVLVVDVAADGINGRHLALNGEYDLIVLDVMLPASAASAS